MNISNQDILNALKHVDDPDLKKDLVTLNMIRDLNVEGNKVNFSVYLTTPACPMKDFIENACRNAIAHFVSDDLLVNIKMTSEVIGHSKSEILPRVKNIIAIASGKGGVGKSTVAAGLALALSESGAATGLMDADIYGPSIPILFGAVGEPVEMEIVDGKELMKPIIRNGIKLFSIGFLSSEKEAVVWRGPMVSSALKQFINGVNWGDLDYLVIDLPPGTGDVQLTIVQNLPLTGAVIVSTPQKLAIADARRACAMFKIQGVDTPILGMVENMSYFSPEDAPDKKYRIFGSGGVQTLANEFGSDVLGEIPIKEQMVEDGDNAGLGKDGHFEIFKDIAGRLVRQIAIQQAGIKTL